MARPMNKFGESLDEYGFPIFEENEFPIAYLLTFRTFGTWHHGNTKGSVGRDKTNVYGQPGISASVPLIVKMNTGQKCRPTILTSEERDIECIAIREVCEFRGYDLYALNVRTNHTHSVVSHPGKPEKIVNAFKAYSPRALRH